MSTLPAPKTYKPEAEFGFYFTTDDYKRIPQVPDVKGITWDVKFVETGVYVLLTKGEVPVDLFLSLCRLFEQNEISYKAWKRIDDVQCLWFEITCNNKQVTTRVLKGHYSDPCDPNLAEQLAYLPFSICDDKAFSHAYLVNTVEC